MKFAAINSFNFAYATAKSLDAEIDDEGVMYLPVLVVSTTIDDDGGRTCQVMFNHPEGTLALREVPEDDLVNAQEWIFDAYMTREEFGNDLDEMATDEGAVEGKARFFRLSYGPDISNYEAMYAP